MKLLVIGSGSQVGQELTRLLADQGVDYSALGVDEIDFSNQADLLKATARINPTQVINAASFADIEKAEIDPVAGKQCELINTLGPSALAEVCHTLKLPLIHHSSSFVFDGSKPQPYAEDSETNPLSRYGLSKWYGERAIQDVLQEFIILRTDWVFSTHRADYFRTHIENCKKNNGKLEVMGHRFSPTPASDIARVILAIARQLDCNAEPWGIYHYCALQAVSEEQFVDLVLHEAAQSDGALKKKLEHLEINIIPLEKPYISNSALSCQKIMETFGIKQRSRAGEVSKIIKSLVKPAKKAAKKK